MVEVYPYLFVGTAANYENTVRHLTGWRVVHACKEPYHRQALGYTGRGAPKDHPEYLIARRGNHLVLNRVDAADPAYIPTETTDAALDFIADAIQAGERISVHCNLGESRSPSIELLYLATVAKAIPDGSVEEAETVFVGLYPQYHPGERTRGLLQTDWDCYRD